MSEPTGVWYEGRHVFVDFSGQRWTVNVVRQWHMTRYHVSIYKGHFSVMEKLPKYPDWDCYCLSRRMSLGKMTRIMQNKFMGKSTPFHPYDRYEQYRSKE